MNTGEKRRERVSALADGELDDGEIESILLSLKQDENKDDWELYHQIGDILRSEEMAMELSSDFSQRMSSLLLQEPILMMPSAHPTLEQLAKKKNTGRNWMLPGLAAAAIVMTVGVISVPHLMDSAKNEQALASSQSVEGYQMSSHDSDGLVVRDPRIDDYVLAHQRFSPSVYSTAQYARSATFEADSNK